MFLTTLLVAASLTPAPEASLEWFGGPLQSAIGKSRSEDKPVMIYFWSNQSGQCRVLWDESLSKPEAVPILDDFTMYSADTGTKAGYALVERFNVTTLPTLLILDEAGQPNDVILGAINLSNLAGEIQRIESGEGTLNTLRAAVEHHPEDIEARGKLAVKFNDLGLREDFEKQRSEIYHMDPKFAHPTTAEFRMGEIQKEIEHAAGEEGNFEYKPLIGFLQQIDHDEVKFSGWNWIAAVADYKHDSETGKRARMAMWDHVSEEGLARTGFEISRHFYALREDLTKKEKRFALKVAQDTMASVEAWCAAEGKPTEASAQKGDKGAEAACAEGCACDGCSTGCVGEGERLASRQLYVARAAENLALILNMNGKRRDALAAIDRSIELDPGNEAYVASRDLIKKRG